MNRLFQKNFLGIFLHTFWPMLSIAFSYYRVKFNNNKLPNLRGETVIIVGTSPNVDLNILNNLDDSMFSIGLHRVHGLYHQTKWRPNLLFIGDELLLRKQSKELLNKQENKTQIILGSRFFVPIKKNNVSYINIIDVKDQIFNDLNSIQNTNNYFCGKSVVLLAMQYCIKNNVKKIILTGVDFSYEKGYFDKKINNIGLNKPEPIIAKNQLIAYIDICKRMGIDVEHSFN